VLLVEGEDHIGDAVNLASRLCDIAESHQVLAPASLVSSLLVNSEVEPVGDLEISGFSEPVPVVRLLPEGGLVDS
jgi:class 3 adenylate cyclase